ncbi:protein-disulfide reductase DsbD domain-containing protein [uncultured Umboniibacter sp.]|uniref:protein-disulfide reductase DsbD family protein n=1 Tax=uncultured Umboniibacter sp. TaxID=1798917 RepID=UPI002608E001|nr:protein-disulfide reductase DsbD domain-containing protein [uncultured Umboniibacter sp.]
MFHKITLTLASLLIFASTAAFAQFSDNATFPAAPSFLAVDEAYQASPEWRNGELSVIWEAEPGYYLYQHQFSHILNGQTLNVDYPDTAIIKFDEFFNQELSVFYDNAYVVAQTDAPNVGDMLVLTFQGCADAGLCYPPETWYFEYLGNGEFSPTDEIETTAASSIVAPIATPSFSWLMVFSAFLGGLILNAMPCVFPVLALKATSFINAGASARQHAWIYTAGVVLSFLLFAAVIVGLALAGQQVGWGFHLQSPIMVTILIYLFVAMALVLALDMPLAQRLMGAGSELQQGHSKSASFFTGLLAVVVASPCTAPFMGAAMGAALTQSAAATFAIFIAIGFGMAAPILVLSYWPGLIQRLPRPGLWMVKVREFMVFPLLATALYLLWVVGQQTGVTGLTMIAFGALLIAMGLWLINMKSKGAKLSGLVFLLLAVYAAKPSAPSSSNWVSYSEVALTEARQAGPVFVDVTAAWCITCLANKRVLNDEEIQTEFTANNVTLMEADWTSADENISRYLSSYGRAGVPLYVYYPNAGEAGIVLPQLLSKNIILETISAE